MRVEYRQGVLADTAEEKKKWVRITCGSSEAMAEKARRCLRYLAFVTASKFAFAVGTPVRYWAESQYSLHNSPQGLPKRRFFSSGDLNTRILSHPAVLSARFASARRARVLLGPSKHRPARPSTRFSHDRIPSLGNLSIVQRPWLPLERSY